ncbi:MAG: DAK2 domain-containing protein [Eubacteriaceae bacterium]|nr:DAK2 domain-containing protein [Eubacteriaceae bacterium]
MDTDELKAAVLSGYANLENNKEYVNNLNVFPVPDGDTGTNMSLTMQYAVKAVTESNAKSPDGLISAAANGALMGARGNSGVILSQLLRGFSKTCMGHDKLDIELCANALNAATQMAYKAVMKPTEGTILTVARGMSEFAMAHYTEYENPVEFFSEVLEAGRVILSKTPEMLPVLKEAGVVDSGGCGLIFIMEGILASMKGKTVGISDGSTAMDHDQIDLDGEFDYTLEFTIVTDGSKSYQKTVIDKLMKIKGCADPNVMEKGSSIKVHILSNEPWNVLKTATAFGTVRHIEIIDSTDLDDALLPETDEPKIEYSREHTDYVIISVSSGKGLSSIMKDLGVTYIVEGGQTMNPSTQDFMEIIDNTDADNYIILPNNKNIILAAKQTCDISRKNVAVVESRNIPQAISAMLGFDPEMSLEDNVAAMSENMATVKVGQVTFAVRDTSVGGSTIKEGDIIGIVGSDIVACENNAFTAVMDIAEQLVDEETSILSLYYGCDVTETDAAVMENKLKKKYPDLDVEIFSGGQPLYYYIISAE